MEHVDQIEHTYLEYSVSNNEKRVRDSRRIRHFRGNRSPAARGWIESGFHL